MSDLIDRQQALEIKFSNAIVRRCAVYVRMDELVNKLNALPSVQPERTEERTEMHACDLISRRAAIDGKISIQLANGVEIYSDEAVPVEYLKNLPTIQPKPREGHWINGKCDRCGGHAPFWAMASTYYESDFCPHCGAKMKGVQHETD